MSEHDNGPDVPELPEGLEVADGPEEFVNALGLKVQSPMDCFPIGISLVENAYTALREMVGPFGEMASLQALTMALVEADSPLRIALIRAATIAEALEGEQTPSEIAAELVERFGHVEEQTNFEMARESWRQIKGATEESSAEVEALEAAFQMPDADEPEIEAND